MNLYGQQKDSARWSAEFNFESGTNYQKKDAIGWAFSNGGGFINGKVSRKTDKLQITLGLGYSDYFRLTSRRGVTYNRPDIVTDKDSYIVNLDLTHTENDNERLNGNLDILWNIDRNNKMGASYRHEIANDTPMSSTLSSAEPFISHEEIYSIIDNWEEITGGIDYTYLYNEGFNSRNTGTFQAYWDHRFEKLNRDLRISAEWSPYSNNEYTKWTKGAGNTDFFDDFTEDVVWRTTPRYKSNNLKGLVKYTDYALGGNKNLRMDLSLDALLKTNDDLYTAANLINGEWVDSTRYRESFKYTSLKLQPTVRLQWHCGKFFLNAGVTPEYYSDKLENHIYSQSFDEGTVSAIFDITGTYTLSEKGSVSAYINRNVNHPGYLNLCWFPRPGSYSREIIRGNPKLKPTKSLRAGLTYQLQYDNFSSRFELGTNYESDRIERTFSTELIDDDEYRVYSWVNAGWSLTSFAKASAAYSTGKLKAELNGTVNYFISSNINNERFRNADYNISGNVNYDFAKGWSAMLNAKYQSKIIRTYNSMTEYIGCNIRVSKSFGKKFRFKVYFEIRDLFDKNIRTEIISEDRCYSRLEDMDYNRRMGCLGINFSF